LYRVILRSLYEARVQLAAIEQSLPGAIEDLYRKVENTTDPFVSQSALREVLLMLRAKGTRLVLVLDPFGQFCRVVSTQVLDNLRGLRDSFKSTLEKADRVESGPALLPRDSPRCWLLLFPRRCAANVTNALHYVGE